MHQAILIYETPFDLQSRDDPARAEAYWGAHANYCAALKKAGVFVGGSALQPPRSATTIRTRGGKRQVQDGPFADTKEELGGFTLIDVPNLDVALEWAAKCPTTATGCVEVRSCLPPLPMPAQ